MKKLRMAAGVWRSILMYYWKPFNKRRLMEFYSQFIGPGDLCFDVGAHLGNRSNAWIALDARVIAVEPQPKCIRYLERRFSAKNVIIVPKAAGATTGTQRLHVSHATPTISTMSDSEWRDEINNAVWYEVRWDEIIDVEVTTLDALIAEYGLPVFCKIDVENYEAEVLRGLSQPITCISFEYFPPALERALHCFGILDALGDYEYNWSFGESLIMQSREWLTSAAMQKTLAGFSKHRQYGDVYAQLRSADMLMR